ncbi:predicted protein [Sclerotinia sclerotiorum 1980 UF-70]|uniref:Uncharacterized protein n=1 Tax=Sclerotinia sclerotiorum (strain ATCC 18683 / 1980 / Ss-1) TaxID=665079 RepID=A7EP96_SCLS1|nr:predicted protein [Sclerotinia sclerotiorum 1980 UF-70]EDO04662.1 predicted protein [Sclerotinia sclerotiorum 1980 UF-70]
MEMEKEKITWDKTFYFCNRTDDFCDVCLGMEDLEVSRYDNFLVGKLELIAKLRLIGKLPSSAIDSLFVCCGLHTWIISLPIKRWDGG